MYNQINPTEIFHERELALMKQRQNRRLARQLHAGAGRETKARRSTVAGSTLALLAALLAAGLLALFAFSVPALGKQSADLQQSAPGSDNKDALVAIESSAVKASFASGSGANFLGVKVSDHGNLRSFESPQGQEATFEGQEGYAVCSNFGNTVHGHDTGSVESGFGAPTFSQPNGTGTFPLTVTRKTTDGKLLLTQVWSKPDPVEKDVTVTMTLKNIFSSPINVVSLSRSGDFDVGNSGQDQGARTLDSAWQWDDLDSNADTPPVGTMLTALTFGTDHGAHIESNSAWVGGSRERCLTVGQTTPTSVQDLTMRAVYGLGDLSAGQSKTVKFEYRRM
jgi:hypothetical protein